MRGTIDDIQKRIGQVHESDEEDTDDAGITPTTGRTTTKTNTSKMLESQKRLVSGEMFTSEQEQSTATKALCDNLKNAVMTCMEKWCDNITTGNKESDEDEDATGMEREEDSATHETQGEMEDQEFEDIEDEDDVNAVDALDIEHPPLHM